MERSFLFFLLLLGTNALAIDSLSYSGRLVNNTGAPVTGSPLLKFDLVYSGNTAVVICSKQMNVPMSNGVFHANLNFTTGDCAGGKTLEEVMLGIPTGQSVAYQVTDLTNTK